MYNLFKSYETFYLLDVKIILAQVSNYSTKLNIIIQYRDNISYNLRQNLKKLFKN